MDVAVLGAGSWGSALAILLARKGHCVTLHGRDPEQMRRISELRENVRYLPGFAMPAEVRPVSDPADLAPETRMWVIAVPSSAVRSELALVRGERPLIVMAAKGLELGAGALLSEVCAEVCPDCGFAALSGPNLAVEIVRGIPTVAVSASADPEHAEAVRSAFMGPSFRVYVSRDVVGVELAGALKNVLAIGAGISDALGFGDNTKGALLARGLREMTLLGLTMGGRIETFMGIAGVGDLFATAVSRLSRNYRVGRSVGEGKTLREALDEVGQVAEGVQSAEAALMLARRHGVEMPLFAAIAGVLSAQIGPDEAVGMLMERMPRSEDSLE